MRKEKLNLPFIGIPSFCKVPICENWSKLDADVAVLGVPFESTQALPGAKMGPRGIRNASTIYSINDVGYYDHEFDEYFLNNVRIVDCGDVDMIHMDTHQCLENAYKDARELISKDVLLVVMGGDHAVPIPIVRAYEEKGPIHVVHFDAHLDFVDERFGVRQGHGNPARRISEMKHVSGLTQIGIRGPGSSGREDFDAAKAYGATIIGPREFRRIGADNVVERLPKDCKFYVTIDVDVFDPALAPGTGSPSPGGLDYFEVTDALRGIAARGEVVGFDFCEVAPTYDTPNGITGQLAARVMLDFIGAIYSERRKKSLQKADQ